MSSHRSLVAFTLLVQCAIGSVWCVGAALFLADTPFRYGWQTIVALLFVLLGMFLSVGHLGRPGVCFYAVRNLEHSWLSREVASTVAFAAAVAAMGLTVVMPGVSSGWIVFVASAVGGLVLYPMARSYQLRTVPSWNGKSTLLSFVGSALLLGGLQSALVPGMAAVISGTNTDVAGLHVSQHVGLFAALIGFVIKVGIQKTGDGHVTKSASFVKLRPPVLESIGVASWVVVTVLVDSVILEFMLLWPAAILLVIAEIYDRTGFYESYRSAGL